MTFPKKRPLSDVGQNLPFGGPSGLGDQFQQRIGLVPQAHMDAVDALGKPAKPGVVVVDVHRWAAMSVRDSFRRACLMAASELALMARQIK